MSPSDPPMGLLLVDDHTIVREGLRRVLETASDAWQITEAGSGFQALQCLRERPFRMAIVDLSMPGMSGLELIKRIRAEFPGVAVLVLSMHAEEQYALRAFRAGARGYVTKDSASGELVAAVRKVASGGAYVTASLAERVVQQLNGAVPAPSLASFPPPPTFPPPPPPHDQLTDRELEVLQRLVAGQRPTEIAAALHLSVKTVSTHKSRIQEKLQLKSTAALIRYGLEHGLDKGDDTGIGA
jgi:DNA-binding NarL/FixJ family response regulator